MKELLWVKTIKEIVFPEVSIEHYKVIINLIITYFDYGVTSRNS